MGVFIAIEGGDGSGKGTQTKLLTEYLTTLGHKVKSLTFPRYGEPSAYYVERYLNGEYGGADDVPADLGVLTFALDRYAASKEIQSALDSEYIVISDRYMASNLAHQGTKVSGTSEERKQFYERSMLTEYEILGIPRPNLNVVLVMPSDLAQQNVDKKAARSYTAEKRDIHEADRNHLDKAKANYEELCELYPEEFTAINCTSDTVQLRSIESIQDDIRQLIDALI